MKIRESLLRKSAIYRVVFQRSEPKRSFFNPGRPCKVILYVTGEIRPVEFNYGDDDTMGYDVYKRLKDELNITTGDDVIEIMKFMLEEKKE
jgi:hypothetical protein